jgi:hypothetical protein
MSRKRKISLAAGQVVAIPLSDGSFGTGHVVATGLFPIFALYARRANHPQELVDGWDVSQAPPLAIVSMPGWVTDGTWPVVAQQSRDYSAFPVPTELPKVSFTSHFASDFLQAYHGLAPWDGMHDPAFYEKQLIPGTPMPPNLRFRKEFPEG